MNEKSFHKRFGKQIIWFIVIIGLISLIGLFYFGKIEIYVQEMVSTYGLVAIFLVALLADIIMQPVAPDLPLAIGITYGVGVFPAILAAILASFFATIFGYYLGWKWGAGGFKRFYGDQKYKKLCKLYGKYSFIVPLAALTPIPYVPICWISGILKMKKGTFLIHAFIPRTIRLLFVGLITSGIVG